MNHLAVLLALLCIASISFPGSFAELLNQESYSFDGKGRMHEIKLQSTATEFKDVFYDKQAHSIIIHTEGDSLTPDEILVYLHKPSFESLLGDGSAASPSDVLILLNGEEQVYDVLPASPRNDYVVWEFKNKPHTTEIELILRPENYRDNAASMTDFGESFSITEKQVRYVMPYSITNGTIDDILLNCDSANLTLYLSSVVPGTLELDIPNSMLGGIFMVLVNEEEWDDVSLEGNVITVQFPENTHSIEILGTFYDSNLGDGVCDVIHDPPHSYVLPPIKQSKSGVLPNKVQCREGLVLTHKYDGSPACVNPESAQKLHERGWMMETKPILQHNENPGSVPLWSYQTDGKASAIAISDDSSLVAMGGKTDDSRHGMLYLLDSHDGSLLWSRTFDRAIGNIAMSSGGRFIAVSGYQIGDGGSHVYQNGAVYLLNSDGGLLWEHLMEGNNIPWSIWVHPEGSSMSFGSGNKVTSLDRQGNLLWEINAEKYFGKVVFSSDGYFVTGSDSGILFFDSTGKRLWDYTTKHESSYALMISQDGKTILVSDSSGTDGNIYCLDSDGNLLWEHPLDEAAQRFSISGDNSYFVASNNWQVMMFDAKGDLLWTNNIPSDATISPDGSFIAGTTFNNGGDGTAITLFDAQGNIISYHHLENRALFSLSDDGKFIAVTEEGVDKDKTFFFDVEKLMMINQDKVDLSEMQASSELHVKAVPQDDHIPFDVTINQGQSLQIPWNIDVEQGYTTTNLKVSTESPSSPELESWITPHNPYTTINGIPPSDRVITVHPSMDAPVGTHTVNILGNGHSVHGQTGWMTDLENKTLGTIKIRVNPSDTDLSMAIGSPHYERQSFCVDMASGNGRTCSGGPTYQTVPVTIYSDKPQTVRLDYTITQKGGWVKFIPDELNAGPDGAKSDMVVAGYLIPFRSNPLAEQPLIIQATPDNGEKTTKVIPVLFGEISVIDRDDSVIHLNRIRTNSNGTSYATSDVVYDSLDGSDNAKLLHVSLSVLGMWNDDGDDGEITDLPAWLSIDIPEPSFVLNANVPHSFIVVANTSNAPESGTYHVAIKQNIGDRDFGVARSYN